MMNVNASAGAALNQSIMSGLAPTIPDIVSGSAPWDLGTVIETSQAGTVTALRFWKSAADTGQHTGRVWDSAGHLLASVVFTNETASGWQQQALSAPIQIAANHTIIVSVNTAAHFGLSVGTMPIQVGVLQATSGSYTAQVGSMPVLFTTNNYFRDIVFMPASGAVTIDEPLPQASVTAKVHVSGNVNLTVPGTHTITITDRDATGHEESASVQITAVVPPPPENKLIQLQDLVYQGSFKLPHGQQGASSFDYGATAMAFNPARGTLFMVGHDWQQMVTEVTIPALGKVADGLLTAAIVQPFTDVTEGKKDLVTAHPGVDTIKIGGLLVSPDGTRLLADAYIWYDGNGEQYRSHFVSGSDLSVQGDVTGPWRIDAKVPDTNGKNKAVTAGFVSGYMGWIPAAWQVALGGQALVGQADLSIISRTSSGPGLFAFNPNDVGTVDPVPATTLLVYPDVHPLQSSGPDGTAWNNGTAQCWGVVFPEGTQSVLFFGRIGTATIGHYGYGEGTTDKSLDGTIVPGEGTTPYIWDPAQAGLKGYHAYPYEYRIWAYDAADLVKVKQGTVLPWDVKPYGVWKLDLGAFTVVNATISGAAYDAATERIFISEGWGDSSYPVIHVYKVS